MLDFDIYIKYVKGKTTNKRNKSANRHGDILKLIHTDIYGSFPKVSWNRQIYFISFIDDYSRFSYLYLIYEKSQFLYMFKLFKAEV